MDNQELFSRLERLERSHQRVQQHLQEIYKKLNEVVARLEEVEYSQRNS